MADAKVEGNVEDVEAMFSEDVEAMFSEVSDDDLLDSIQDDMSEAWMPTEPGKGIIGKVVKIDQVKSDFALPGQDPMVPSITLEVKSDDGKLIQLRVVGYAFLLRKGIEEADPRIGDTMAFKFHGKAQTKKGNPINKYGVAIRRATR